MSAGCTLYKFTSLIDADEPLESPDSLTYGGEFMKGPHDAYTPIFVWRATTVTMSAGCTLYKFTSLIDADEPLESPNSLTYGGEFM